MFDQRVECVCPWCSKHHSSMLKWILQLGYVCPDCKKKSKLPEHGEKVLHFPLNGRIIPHANLEIE